MKIKHKIIILLSCWLWLTELQAQTVRTISVAQGLSYTDHISMKEDVKDMDLMVKFVFNEDDNTLSVTLISYRTLFTFWDNVHYKPLIKGRKLRPDQLPYVVEYDPKDKFKVTKLFKATVPSPREDFFFRRWIEYDGLQPAPQEYKMVNDFITQKFDIQNKRSQVRVKLRDVFLMDKIEKKKYNIDQIPLGRDLDMEYQVNIQRNTCFGLDEDVAAANSALESIKTSYASLVDQFKGKTITSDGKKVFDDLKNALKDQFQKKDVDSPCPDIQNAWDEYNQYVDSIGMVKCVVQDPVEMDADGTGVPADMKILISKAREIDKMVSRWLVSNDPIEKMDLVKRCNYIIEDVNATYGRQVGRTAEQQQALAIFRAAERYFRNTCKQY